MSMTPHAIHKRSGWSLLPIAATLAFGLVLTPAPGLWGQSAAAPSPGKSEVQFEVLDVTTGTGSKTQTSGESGGPASGQAPGMIPAIPTALPGITPAPPRPLTPEQRELMDKYAPLMAALEQWHRQTLSNYRVDVTALADPFMPIEEVRGTRQGPDEGVSARPCSPPIMCLDLSQLKLVAITILSDRPGGALASFEDGAGNSYILRQGDAIGRNNGKITRIAPSVVTVEEYGRGARSEKPRVTDIRLSVLSREGLTVND